MYHSFSLSIHFLKPKHAIIRDLMIDKYIGTGEDHVKNRDGLTEMLGDMLFKQTQNFHLSGIDAGAPVYLYEYQHPPKFLAIYKKHFSAPDTWTQHMFQHIIFTSDSCPEEEEKLSKIMMSYWGNFARTGSPNGDGLVHWPKYEAGEEYLAIGLKQQVTGHHLKKDRFVLLTQTLPEKVKQHQEKMERSEL
uniref:Carboxylesterase type B domain-containing protein n=1 Tax=Anabas testudineus TaxID=64144 RepID=A0A7N6BY77_ANATE